MGRFFPLLFCFFIACLFTACGESNLDRLNGKWSIDTAASMKAAGVDMENEMERQLAEALFNKLHLNVDAKNKKITMSLGDMEESSAFAVGSESGDRIVLKTGENEEITFDFTDNDAVTVNGAGSGNQALFMKRMQ